MLRNSKYDWMKPKIIEMNCVHCLLLSFLFATEGTLSPNKYNATIMGRMINKIFSAYFHFVPYFVINWVTISMHWELVWISLGDYSELKTIFCFRKKEIKVFLLQESKNSIGSNKLFFSYRIFSILKLKMLPKRNNLIDCSIYLL